MILEVGVAVLVVVFLFYYLITRGNPPKDVLFFGNEHNYVHFPTYLQHISKYTYYVQRLITAKHSTANTTTIHRARANSNVHKRVSRTFAPHVEIKT